MKFDVLTLFPDSMRKLLDESIIGRAQENGYIMVDTINIRDFSENKHKKVDDYPYGGGMGMVMTPQPIFSAWESVISKSIQAPIQKKKDKMVEMDQYQQPDFRIRQDKSAENIDIESEIEQNNKPYTIYMSPQGKVLNQDIAVRLSRLRHIIILCGHYEGVDERVLEEIVDEEISIGDYVLTGGELPAMVLIDCVSRMVEGVLPSKEAYSEETHYSGLVEFPQYTRPEAFRNRTVPAVLLSGHHSNIAKWRFLQMLERTKNKRPDMFKIFENNHKDRVLEAYNLLPKKKRPKKQKPEELQGIKE